MTQAQAERTELKLHRLTLQELHNTDKVHGGKVPGARVAKVRYNGRHWLRVWAVRTDSGFRVEPCDVFPKGGNWSEAEAYFI